MKFLKPHYWYNKRQQSGVLFLLIVIILLQLVVVFSKHSVTETSFNYNTSEMITFQAKLDSLHKVTVAKRKFKIYPFNPNYISDYKGYQLGMSISEIDRLHAYRKQRKFINSAKEFQNVTKVSDSLLGVISPFFKFPDWVLKKEQRRVFNAVKTQESITRKLSTKKLNKATQKDFETIKGVGEILAKRIVAYRGKLQGFTYTSQLYEVWGLKKEIAETILKEFKIVEQPVVLKLNINTATFKQVLKVPYIDYKLCKKIFEYRDEVAELQDISELTNIKDFPIEKYDRIILYLEAK